MSASVVRPCALSVYLFSSPPPLFPLLSFSLSLAPPFGSFTSLSCSIDAHFMSEKRSESVQEAGKKGGEDEKVESNPSDGGKVSGAR